MEDPIALQMGAADVAEITPKIIADTIEEVRRGKRVWAQFFKDNRDLEKNGGDYIVFPKKSAGVVVTTNMSAGQTIDTTYMTYDAVTISVKKHGVGLGFYGEAIRTASRDVVADNIKEAGEAYADAMDTLALESMFPAATVTASGASTVSCSFPVIGIKSKTSGFSHIEQDSSSAKAVFTAAGTVVYWYVPSTAGARTVTASAGSLALKDIFAAKADIEGNNFSPDVLVVHPDLVPDILFDPAVKWLEASAYRGSEELYNGELAKVFGLKVVVTTKCPRYGAVLLASKDVGWHVIKQPLKLREDPYTGMKNDVLYYWGIALENFGVVNEKSYGAIAYKGTLTEANPVR